jgi:crotonobetainyl-CoA:carnitine CoA-transferase CaiB-like acyl-CoA transferase
VSAVDTDPRRQPADPDGEVRTWAASGAMALTGRADAGPLGPPAGLVPALSALGDQLRQQTARSGRPVDIDPLALLGERAAIADLRRQGSVSCGGRTRLLPTRDGWLALTLARPDDDALVPAWLECEDLAESHERWEPIAAAVARRRVSELTERGRLLGLPVAALPRRAQGVPAANRPSTPAALTEVRGAPAPARSLTGLRVADLSGLWAGPLCGSLLASAGATVVKVESTSRPDGARGGPAVFFDLLNGAKSSVALDLGCRRGVRMLRALLQAVDVVIESSRPRALAQLGIDAAALVAGGGPQVWVSITGHGRTGEAGGWTAFGDDAAVAGGLVAWDDAGPCFCADAVADPIAGLVAANAALDALAAGGRWMVDVPLARVAAHLAGPTLPVTGAPVPAPPRARPAPRPAPRFGAQTAEVLATWAAVS